MSDRHDYSAPVGRVTLPRMLCARSLETAVPRDNRFTRVWVLTAGRWQLVANHYSLMAGQ